MQINNRNDNLASFWHKVSDLYDQDKTFRSRIFSDSYNDNESLIIYWYPVSEEFHIQVDSFRQRYTFLRGTIEKIHGNIRLSGQIERYITGCNVNNFVSGDGKEHSVAYTFLTLQAEDMLQDFCTSIPWKYAAIMPLLATMCTPSSKKKTGYHPSTPGKSILSVLEHLSTNFECFKKSTDIPDRLRDVKELYHHDEASMLEYRSKLPEFTEIYTQTHSVLKKLPSELAYFLMPITSVLLTRVTPIFFYGP